MFLLAYLRHIFVQLEKGKSKWLCWSGPVTGGNTCSFVTGPWGMGGPKGLKKFKNRKNN